MHRKHFGRARGAQNVKSLVTLMWRSRPSTLTAGAVGGVVGDGGGEDLAGDVGLVLAGGGEQLLVAAEGELDAVGDLEAGRFAGVLDGVDDLAGEALAAQLVVELELQGDGVAGLGLDLVALERLQGEGDLVGRRACARRRRC